MAWGRAVHLPPTNIQIQKFDPIRSQGQYRLTEGTSLERYNPKGLVLGSLRCMVQIHI